VAGLDFPSKLRRGIGQGQVVSAEQLLKLITPFDADNDGYVTKPELVEFLKRSAVGGPWFCEWMANTFWEICERWLARQVPGIKVDLIARLLHETMKAQPRPAKRIRITPEGANGYEAMEYLDGSGLAFDPKGDATWLPHKSGAGSNAKPRPASTAAPQPQPRPGSAAAPANARPGPPTPRGRAPASPSGRPTPAPRGAAPAPRRPGPGSGPRR
jgi:hypothetical protein